MNIKYNKQIKSGGNYFEGSSGKKTTKTKKRSFYENLKVDKSDSESSSVCQEKS